MACLQVTAPKRSKGIDLLSVYQCRD